VRPKGSRSGSELLELRQRREAASPPVLRGGFRPFFLAAGVWAFVSILLWLGMIEGMAALPRGIEPLAWHRHEMLFGFAGAAVAGFLLTAIPNWTGRLPIAGGPLAGLLAVWTAARLALLLVHADLLAVAAVLDAGFYFLITCFALREVLAAKQNRNLPVALLVLLLGSADALDYLSLLGFSADPLLGIRAGLSILILMISVIGGRIIPSFTRNWLVKRGMTERLPGQPGRYDLATVAATALALALWVLLPDARATGGALVAASLLQGARLGRWRGFSTVPDPLLLVLHIGYFWLAVGLLLLGLAILSPEVPRSAAIHALGVGAVATMILAVTTRASLGHTGRELRAPGPVAVAYAVLSLAALIRVATAFGWLDYLPGLRLAAALWAGAFLLFLVVYGPILSRPRLGSESAVPSRR
jgi:uncharacterized protein involved in response to NO